MSDEIRVEAAFACRIAGVDRARLNEDVHAGLYPAAPKTMQGSKRMFGRCDLIALYVLGRLRDSGVSIRAAGKLASELHKTLGQDIDEMPDVVIYTRCTRGQYIGAQGEIIPPTLGRQIFSIRFEIKSIWEHLILPHLEE